MKKFLITITDPEGHTTTTNRNHPIIAEDIKQVTLLFWTMWFQDWQPVDLRFEEVR